MCQRRRLDAVLCLVGVLVLALTMAAAGADQVPGWEEAVFRSVNGLPDVL